MTPPTGQVLAAGLLVMAVTVLAWLWREQRPWFTMGWLWFIGTLIPVIGLVQVGIQAHADRYTYLPSIGLWVLIVWTTAELARVAAPSRVPAPGRIAPPPQTAASPQGRLALPRPVNLLSRQAVLAAGVALALLIFASLTRSQLALWADTEKLMRHTERVAGSSELVRGSLGGYYYQKGRLEEAEHQYKLGLLLDGNAWPSVVGLANVYAARDKPAEAERLYRRALAGQLCPAHHFLLADFLQDQNRLDEARVHYLQGLALAPYHAGARNQLGTVYAKQQNWTAAREQFERALKLNPKAASPHYNLGNLLAIQGNRAEAIRHFQKALTFAPEHPFARNALGQALAMEERVAEAIPHYQRALASKPDFVEAHLNLAEALARRGELAQAQTHFATALRLQTNSARAHLGLAGVLTAQNKPRDAISHLREAIRIEPQNPEPLNNFAWLLATHPDPAIRNGPEAVRLAARAVELTKTNDAELLDTLAAAHAASGQFTQAVVVAQQAWQLAVQTGQTNAARGISNRWQRYRSGLDFRQE